MLKLIGKDEDKLALFCKLIAAAALLLTGPSAFCFYNPLSGRWLTRDPLDEAGGLNVYGTRNALISEYDGLGLCGSCCECALDVQILDPALVPDGSKLGWQFTVKIYLEYHSAQSRGSVTYKWEEKTHEPPSEIIRAGGRPDQWYDYFALVPDAIPSQWKNRSKACNPPVGRTVYDGDWPRRPLSKGKWVLQFRLSLLNPGNCGCDKERVTAMAVATLDPHAAPVPGSFQTPDPNQ